MGIEGSVSCRVLSAHRHVWPARRRNHRFRSPRTRPAAVEGRAVLRPARRVQAPGAKRGAGRPRARQLQRVRADRRAGGSRGGLLPESWVVALAIAVALSFAISAPLNRFSHSIYARVSPLVSRLERRQRHPDDEPISLGAANVAVFGMGRVGCGAYDLLKQRGMRVVGFDSDPGEVGRHLAEGRRVVYGDAEDPDLWQRLRLDGLSAVLLALPDIEAKVFAVTEIRRAGYRGLLSATNVYANEADQILSLGCTTTYNYYEQAGVGFAEQVWETMHGDQPPHPPGVTVDP